MKKWIPWEWLVPETLREKALAELELVSYSTDQLRFYIQHSDRMELIDLSQNLDNYFDTAQEVKIDVIWKWRRQDIKGVIIIFFIFKF